MLSYIISLIGNNVLPVMSWHVINAMTFLYKNIALCGDASLQAKKSLLLANKQKILTNSLGMQQAIRLINQQTQSFDFIGVSLFEVHKLYLKL